MIRWIVGSVLLAAALPAAAAPAALVCAAAGKAQVQSAGKTDWKPLRVLAKLEAGDKVRCEAGAQATVLLLSSKERFQIGPGTAEIQAGTVSGGKSLGGLRAGNNVKVGEGVGALVSRNAGESQVRLTRNFTGWLPAGERRIAWDPIPGAASTRFTLFDAESNVVWAGKSAGAAVELPADVTLEVRRPYIWRIAAANAEGKPLVGGSRWGVLTFLDAAEGAALDADAKALADLDKTDKADPSSLVLLAELYRTRGVLMRTLEALDTLNERGQPGIEEAMDAVYTELGPLARGLAGRAAPADN